jgi:hypothetical protein
MDGYWAGIGWVLDGYWMGIGWIMISNDWWILPIMDSFFFRFQLTGENKKMWNNSQQIHQ